MMAVTQNTAEAEPVTLSGITFSDELGGFVIVDGRGSGSPEDPFVIVEQMATDRPTVLVVRGLTEEFGNPARTNHFSGFRLIKIVINGTDQTWNGYRMSLEQELGEGSPRFDGLSFGQEFPPANRSFTADRFSDMTVLDEPLDGIAFAGGSVRPGDRVAFTVDITHNAPREQFFLVQRHEQSIAGLPGGFSASLSPSDQARGRLSHGFAAGPSLSQRATVCTHLEKAMKHRRQRPSPIGRGSSRPAYRFHSEMCESSSPLGDGGTGGAVIYSRPRAHILWRGRSTRPTAPAASRAVAGGRVR